MFLSQSAHETTGCSHLPETLSSITCVMYASISTSNPFLTQTNDCRSMGSGIFFLRDLAAPLWRLLGQRTENRAFDLHCIGIDSTRHVARLCSFNVSFQVKHDGFRLFKGYGMGYSFSPCESAANDHACTNCAQPFARCLLEPFVAICEHCC